jgi:hypothetical protein
LVVDLKNLKRDTKSGVPPATVMAVPARRRLPVWVCAATIAAVLALAAGAYLLRGRPATNSIAVLPFASAGSDPNTEIWSDSLTEQLINNLSQLTRFRFKPSWCSRRAGGKWRPRYCREPKQ